MAYIIGTVFNEFAYSFLLVFISDIGFLETVKTELVKNDCYAGGEKQYQSNPYHRNCHLTNQGDNKK